MGVNCSNSIIVVDSSTVKQAVECYYDHQIPPIVDQDGYKFFIMLALAHMKDDVKATKMSVDLWTIFSYDGIPHCSCHSQEILAFLTLACSGTFLEKMEILYDLFKCWGTPEVAYEDILYGIDTIICAFARYLQHVEAEKPIEFPESTHRVAEMFTDAMFVKMDKELEDMISKEVFMKWVQGHWYFGLMDDYDPRVDNDLPPNISTLSDLMVALTASS